MPHKIYLTCLYPKQHQQLYARNKCVHILQNLASFDSQILTCRSAAKLGYFRDDFVGYFCKRQERKPPIINRGNFSSSNYVAVKGINQLLGYYARVAAMRKILKEFIRHGGKQIVSLGAGFDTNYFVLQVVSPYSLITAICYLNTNTGKLRYSTQ